VNWDFRVRRLRTLIGVMGIAGLMLALVLPVLGARVLPAFLDVEQEPGTRETYILTVLNDTDEPEELQLSVGDWQRFEDGEHDYDVPLNSGRWIFDRPFEAGEVVEIVYTAQLPDAAELSVTGTFRTFSPQVSGEIDGANDVSSDVVGLSPSSSEVPVVWIGRALESLSETGVATFRLTLQCNIAFDGLLLYETFSTRSSLASIENGGARFDTVNRSNAGWVTLSHDRLVLEPDESREVTVTVDAPAAIDGTYWCAVFVQSQPRVEEQGGTRIVSIPRAAIKVYVTAMGSTIMDGQVIDVQVGETDPLIVLALFENTGNSVLVVTGQMQVIDRSGETVRDILIDDFKVLPGAKRIVAIPDVEGAEALPPDIYQAVVSFEYGGDNPVVGVRGFRVR